MAKEPFSLKDLGTLKEGVLSEEAGFKPLSSFDIDFTLRPETVFGALPFGDISVLGQAIGKYQTEDAANRLLGRDKGFQDTLKGAGTFDSATSQIIREIKEQKAKDDFSTEPNITRDDIQKYARNKRPDLFADLAPIQTPKFTKQQLDAKTTDFFRPEQQYSTQPYKSRGFAEQMTSRATSADGLGVYDLEEQGRFREAQNMYDANIKSTDQFAEDKITQTNITNYDPNKGTYDPAFSRAVTLENQGDTANADTTFICTVLFEMNILPMKIYKYDQRYGQKVNRRIYNGYALWGKPLAERIRKQGLAYKIMTPIACAWAEQMAYDLSDGKVGTNRISIKIAKFLGETICYTLGLFIKPKGEKNARTHTRNRQHGTKRGTIHGKNGISKGRGRPKSKR